MSIVIKEKRTFEGSYTHDLFIGELLASDMVYKNDEGFYEVDSLIEGVSVKEFLHLRGQDIPEELRLHVYEHTEEHFFSISNITRDSGSLILSFWTPFQKVNKLPFKEKEFYSALKPKLDSDKRITYEISDDFEFYENHYISSHVELDGIEKTIEDQIDEARSILDKLVGKAKDDLNGLNWKSIYNSNEKIFTQEVVIPLLQKLGFENVQYNHGQNEFGRDITFATINAFNETKYGAAQVKVGNISGKVKGEIDEIIQQLDDAFGMPLNILNEPQEIYISEMIIATSGSFTENAKQKIRYKINKSVASSLTFLDKESIMNHYLRVSKDR